MSGAFSDQLRNEQQVGSGFLRCQMTTNEGGTIPEENLVFYTRDRTETTSRVWLGLTANCAVCHDHKFDPITQRDFYSMSAFFNNTMLGPLDGNIKDTPPVVTVPGAADRARWDALAVEMGDVRKQMDERRAVARPEFDKWLAGASVAAVRGGIPAKDLRLHAPLDEGQGEVAHVAVDGQVRSVPLAAGSTWQAGQVSSKALQPAAGGLTQVEDAGDFDRDRAFSVAVWAKLPAKNSDQAPPVSPNSLCAHRTSKAAAATTNAKPSAGRTAARGPR